MFPENIRLANEKMQFEENLKMGVIVTAFCNLDMKDNGDKWVFSEERPVQLLTKAKAKD